MEKKIVGGEKFKKGTRVRSGGYVYLVTANATEPGFCDVECVRNAGQVSDIPEKERTRYRRQSVTNFGFIVSKPGKMTQRKRIAGLTAEVAFRDATIEKIKAEFAAQSKRNSEQALSERKYRDEQISSLRSDRDRMAKAAQEHEESSGKRYASVEALKNALKSASEALYHASNAVKA